MIAGHAYANIIGDGRTIPANLISGNTGNGVTLGMLTSLNRVIRNYIGLDRIGRPMPNSGRQVVDNGSHNTVTDNR